MISVIIPAHNEEQIIRRTLDGLAPGVSAGDLEVIVVCNGCQDRTAEIARSYEPAVRVLETSVPSKANALNMGDAAARSFPRVYMDADVVMSPQSLRRLAQPLADERFLAAAPAVDTVFRADADWSVRAYYRFWMALPFIQEGMMAAGVYAVSAAGRKRFDQFPSLISDDGFFRLQFASAERLEVKDAVSQVFAPARLMDLVRIKTRSRLGVLELQEHYPQLFAREARSKRYGAAIVSMLRRPDLYAAAIPYVLINLYTRRRARRQAVSRTAYRWERDVSSRE